MTDAVSEQTSPYDAPERAPGPFAVEVTDEGDLAVAWLSGELDVDSAPRLLDVLDATTAKQGQRLLVDLSHLDFVDAAGLRAILAARDALRARSGDLRLRASSPFVTRVLEITRLTELALPFAPSESHEEPLAAART